MGLRRTRVPERPQAKTKSYGEVVYSFWVVSRLKLSKWNTSPGIGTRGVDLNKASYPLTLAGNGGVEAAAEHCSENSG